MPPPPSQKGTGKKGGRGSDSRRSRSRNTTPAIVSSDTDTAYLDIAIKPIDGASYDEIVDPSTSSAIPDSKALETVMSRVQNIIDQIEARDDAASKALRKIIEKKNERAAEERENENARRQRDQRELDEQERARKANKKRKIEAGKVERPPTQGSHVLASQDGSNLDQPAFASRSSSILSEHDEAVTPESHTVDTTIPPNIDSDSSDDDPPAPVPKMTNTRVFGDDPSTFEDPTRYEIKKVNFNTMSDSEIEEAASVSVFPHDDLHDLIPGTPPDQDFSSAKPSNQVQANTFQTYLEPYFRNFNEDDEAWLRDRGDRVTPYVIPSLGKKSYREIWDEEDDRDMGRPAKLAANQPRGSIEDMNDAVAETDQVSIGPLNTRLLQMLRHEGRRPHTDPVPAANGLTSVDDLNLEMMGADPMDIAPILADEPPAPLPPATQMPESSSEAWKKTNHPKIDYYQVDERIKQELQHIGIIPADVQPNYDEMLDSEVTARLRYLQAQLKEVSIRNGARKARIMDMLGEEQALQEYDQIKDDLDNQLNSAYIKSTRTMMGKNKKAKRPGGAGGGSNVAGVARPGVRDQTRGLMERREHWMDAIGPAFKDEPTLGKVPRARDPNSSIFKDMDMSPYLARERELFEEESGFMD